MSNMSHRELAKNILPTYHACWLVVPMMTNPLHSCTRYYTSPSTSFFPRPHRRARISTSAAKRPPPSPLRPHNLNMSFPSACPQHSCSHLCLATCRRSSRYPPGLPRLGPITLRMHASNPLVGIITHVLGHNRLPLVYDPCPSRERPLLNQPFPSGSCTTADQKDPRACHYRETHCSCIVEVCLFYGL